MRIALIAAAVLAFSLPFRANATTSVPNGAQRAALARWLDRNPQFRLATEEDCDCGDDIQLMRRSGPWGEPVPGYVPYALVGDFRRNGQSDLAVVVTKVDRPDGEAMLVIFDGPFGGAGKQPSFIGQAGLLAHEGLSLTQQEKLPIYGAFYSEGCVFRPKGSGYVKDCGDD